MMRVIECAARIARPKEIARLGGTAATTTVGNIATIAHIAMIVYITTTVQNQANVHTVMIAHGGNLARFRSVYVGKTNRTTKNHPIRTVVRPAKPACIGKIESAETIDITETMAPMGKGAIFRTIDHIRETARFVVDARTRTPVLIEMIALLRTSATNTALTAAMAVARAAKVVQREKRPKAQGSSIIQWMR